jgi:hypothetical protein
VNNLAFRNDIAESSSLAVYALISISYNSKTAHDQPMALYIKNEKKTRLSRSS